MYDRKGFVLMEAILLLLTCSLVIYLCVSCMRGIKNGIRIQKEEYQVRKLYTIYEE